MADAEILNISTERAEPKYVTIEHQGTKSRYPIVNPDDLEVRQFLWMSQASKKLFGMRERDLSDAEGADLENILDRAVRMVLPDLPDDVRSRLGDAKKLSILDAFSAVVEGIVGEAPRPDLMKSSPDSSTSTVEPSRTGSTPE